MKDVTVGFYIQTPFHYYLYESIIDELTKNNINSHLVLNDHLQYDYEWGQMYNGLIDFVEKLDRNDIEAFTLSTIVDHSFIYDCFISPYYTNEIRDLGKLQVRLMYSLAKENWTYAWWNVFYDKVLCYGEYDFKKLNLYNNANIVGNPKFDSWFNNKLPEKEEIIKIYNIDFDHTKKTILYAPTYGDLSSIDKWIDTIDSLQDNFNILVKLHHGTVYLNSEETRREIIDKKFNNVYNDQINLLNLLKVTDYVISDYSGIIFDALLANKYIILLNNEVNTEFTDSHSAEIKIREKLNEANTEHELRQLLIHPQQCNNQIIDNFFSNLDGNAGKRAANVIMELINNPQSLEENKFLLSIRRKILNF